MDATARLNASHESRALLVIAGGRDDEEPDGQTALIAFAAEPQSGDPRDPVLVTIGHHSNAPDLAPDNPAFGREAFGATECLFAMGAVEGMPILFAAAPVALEAHSLAAEVYLGQPEGCECHLATP